MVDVQNDFCPGGALPVPGGDEVAAVLAELTGRFEAVYATRDWHPPDHGSFAGQIPGGSTPLQRSGLWPAKEPWSGGCQSRVA